MAAVRLIATDLDGTLLRHDGTVSDRNRAAIREAHRAGIHVVAATGRGWRSATPLLRAVPEVTTAVLSNGALVRDLIDGTDHQVSAIDAAVLTSVLAIVADVAPSCGIFWETPTSWGFDDTYLGMIDGSDDVDSSFVPSPLPDDGSVIKVLVRHPTMAGPELGAHLLPVLPDSVTVAWSGGPNLIEITGPGVDKAHGLSALCAMLDVDPGSVVAFGDNHNDVAMLEWAGTGVAMANATPTAVAASDQLTGHHLDDGVAQVIESILASG